MTSHCLQKQGDSPEKLNHARGAKHRTVVGAASVAPHKTLEPPLEALDRQDSVGVRQIDRPKDNLLLGDAGLEREATKCDGEFVGHPRLQDCDCSCEATDRREKGAVPLVTR